MQYPKIIGFAGRAQSGKTTAANIMATHGWLRISFADPLRDMLAILCDVRDKTTPQRALCGHTVRYALQTLGTDWGRQMIGEDIWEEAMRSRLERLAVDIEDEVIRGVAIDDVRFDNEADLIRELGGVVVNITRSSCLHMDHASERGVNATLVSCHIANEGTVDELHAALAAAGVAPPPPRLELPASSV